MKGSSSLKMTQGDEVWARENTWQATPSLSPTYYCIVWFRVSLEGALDFDSVSALCFSESELAVDLRPIPQCQKVGVADCCCLPTFTYGKIMKCLVSLGENVG